MTSWRFAILSINSFIFPLRLWFITNNEQPRWKTSDVTHCVERSIPEDLMSVALSNRQGHYMQPKNLLETNWGCCGKSLILRFWKQVSLYSQQAKNIAFYSYDTFSFTTRLLYLISRSRAFVSWHTKSTTVSSSP